MRRKRKNFSDTGKIRKHFKGNFNRYYERRGLNLDFSGDGQAMALCPFHQDNKPSFSINTATGQFHCFGCNEKGDIFTFEALKKRLSIKNDFSKILKSIADEFKIPLEDKTPTDTNKTRPLRKRRRRKRSGTNDEAVIKYTYRNENGRPLYMNCRGKEKDFWQCLPDGTKKLGNVQRVPYHLPELIKADTVLFVEGEKDVHTAESFGFMATTTSSSTSWKPGMAKWFEDKNVFLIPDNDDPGRKYMEKVGVDLHGVANTLKWINLPHRGREGFDLTDFAERFKGPRSVNSRLRIYISRTRPYIPKGAPISAKEIMNMKFPKIKWAVPDILPEGLSILASKPKIGKSIMAMNIGLSITTENKVMDHIEADYGPVIYLALEDTTKRLNNRLETMLVDQSAPGNLFFYTE